MICLGFKEKSGFFTTKIDEVCRGAEITYSIQPVLFQSTNTTWVTALRFHTCLWSYEPDVGIRNVTTTAFTMINFNLD